ncbi:RNA 3'-terminal phosphate cyclase [Halobacteriales archaeon QS_8_69_26]|nr:MAG: RNA 3'-terminal phosphate cyclase [Halobacteriales archaeon QS_8_69_26]
MIEIDGGIGGGQVVRTALALSAVTGEPVTVEDVRGNRSEPGLEHQHLAAVRVLGRIADADVEGDELGSGRVVFEPGAVRGGEYEVDIPTAGSVTLLFDAVLPLAVATPDPIAVTATGGTAVKWSPTMAYYRRVKLPLLRRAGLQAAVDVDRVGYYPTGGGRARLSLAPSTVTPTLGDRGEREVARVYSAADWRLSDDDVARCQAEAAAEALRESGVDVADVTTASVAADCPGSSVAVRVDYGTAIAGFDSLGEPGRPAEAVGEAAAGAAREFHAGPGAVDEHMADQLLPFLGLCGGRVLIPEVTDHVESSIELLGAFDRGIAVRESGDGWLLVGDD